LYSGSLDMVTKKISQQLNKIALRNTMVNIKTPTCTMVAYTGVTKK